MADKAVDLRIFRDEEGLTNRSLLDVGGEMLVVSQFTLYADTRKGRRPSFIGAAPPDLAATLVEVFARAVQARGIRWRAASSARRWRSSSSTTAR